MTMVSQIEAEKLARKACEDYMTKCNCKDMNDARKAAKKMMAVAADLFETMHSKDVQIDTVQ